MFVIYCYPPDGDGAACRVVKDWGLLWLILTVEEFGDEFIIASDEVICKLPVESGNKLVRDSEEQMEQKKGINQSSIESDQIIKSIFKIFCCNLSF